MTNEEMAKELADNRYTYDVNSDNCEWYDCYLSAIEMAEWKEQQMIDKAVEWVDYNNRNGSCLFDGWQQSLKKAMEE